MGLFMEHRTSVLNIAVGKRVMGSPLFRVLIRLGVLAAIVATAHYAGQRLMALAGAELQPLYQAHGNHAILGALLLYIVLMALPFVPGMEVSLVLMLLLGGKGIVMVYGATVFALSLSFLIGQSVPQAAVTGVLGWLHLHRARDFVARVYPLNPSQRLDLLLETAPRRIVPYLIRHRYLTMAIVFNLPGNSIVGGGGGIGFIAGLSRLFEFPKYLLTVCIAISPVPAALLVRALLS